MPCKSLRRLPCPRAHATVDALCDWLQQTRAQVIVVAPEGTTVWSPEMKDPRWMRRALVNATDAAVASLHEDLRTIDERSRQFLERVTDVDALPKSYAVLETGGGTYLDPARRLMVHKLKQEGFDYLTAPAPALLPAVPRRTRHARVGPSGTCCEVPACGRRE